MKKRMLLATSLTLILTLTLAMKPASAVDTLTPNDFKLQSFTKTLDFFKFCRDYATANNKTGPPGNWHAYLYQNYINASGFQLYYSGLINITAGTGALSIPVQSFIEHYKTPNGKDVLTSSSFIMLLAFNETAATTKYVDSPDVNDILYASFSYGLDLSYFGNATIPALSSKTELIPLESSNNNLTWTWGMRYTNLTAVWMRMFINNATFSAIPVAMTTYDELTFTYRLDIDPSNNKATVTSSYVVGRMLNLWFIEWQWFQIGELIKIKLPMPVYYNSTGKYFLNGTHTTENIYQFLDENNIKMSIVLFQNSLVLNYDETKSTYNNQDVNNTDTDVSNGAIVTQAANEDIFKADFGVKKQYKLYNYTADPTETDFDTYDAVTRTAPRTGYAKNPLFSLHVALLNYVPVIVKHIAPELYQKALTHMLNMTYADYFYVISYPKYSGFKVEHDPTFTAYIATPPSSGTLPPNLAGIVGIIIIAIIVIAVIGTVLFLRRRSTKTQATPPTTIAPSSPEPTTPTNP